MQEIAKKNNVVIVNSIYERDEEKERIWNTCVVDLDKMHISFFLIFFFEKT